MDKKHNPLTTSYPKYDKVLALIRKSMIINETTEFEVCWQLFDDFADVYLYPAKKITEYSYTISVSGLDNADRISELKYVFNYILTKGSFPAKIPDFNQLQQTLNHTTNLMKKLKK